MKKLFFILSLIPVTLTVVIFPYIQDDLILVVRILLYGLVVLIFAAIIISLFWLYERFLTLRANRKKEQNLAAQNNYLTQTDGYGMLHLVNVTTGHSQNLTLDARAYRNGHFEVPHPIELENLRNILASRHAGTAKTIIEQSAQLLPPARLDLLRVFTQPTQSYAIIGGQQVGKTFQAMRIANYWLQSGIKPIVVGPKWDKGEWQNCTLFGGEYNFDKVAQGMQTIKKLAEDRHGDTSKSHKQHPIQPVFFDDWTAIRASLKEESENFVLDATTLYASVNIILYFIIHLDTGAAWGVDKVGASLKNNFIKLIIQPGYDEFGQIQRSKNIGWLVMPGETIKDKKQVDLFSGNGQQTIIPDLVIQPQDTKKQIEEMVQRGEPYHVISQAIWGEGKIGSYYNRKIDQIRGK